MIAKLTDVYPDWSREPSAAELIADGRAAEADGERATALARYEQVLMAAARRKADAGQVTTALVRIASLHNRMGRRDLATEIVEVGVYIAAASGLGVELGDALLMQSTVTLMAGDQTAGERIALAARAQAESSDTERQVAFADNILGTIAAHRGDRSGALLRFASALAYGQRAGDAMLTSMCENNIGRAYVALGMPEEATPRFEEAVRVGRTAFPGGTVNGNVGLAMLYAESGLVEKAEYHAREALETAMAIESPEGAAYAHVASASAAVFAGKLEAAERSIRVSELLARQVAEPELAGDIAICTLSLLIKANSPGPALAALERAEACYTAVPDLWGQKRLSQRATELRRLIRHQEVGWLRALAARAPGESTHARRVAGMAVMLAELVGLSEAEHRALEIGALLHDIGLLSLPDYVVGRPDLLTSLERDIIRGHAELGYDRLLQAGYPESVRRIVRHHHERWDGRGYPDRLAGQAIPIGARVTAIAERYDALRRGRGPRSGLTEGAALRRLAAEAGSAFDPDLCARFIDAIRSGYDEEFDVGHTPDATAVPRSMGSSIDDLVKAVDAEVAALLVDLRETVGSRYEIRRELGGAGMASVFVARDPVLARDVVIKAMHARNVGPMGAARFRREMALAARIRHPNVLPVLDAHIDGRVLYFVAPFIEGGSLRTRIDQGPLDVDAALAILRDVANALAAAHAEGVVHRDLKPENILMDVHGESRAILADFGIARVVEISHAAAAADMNGARLTYTGVSLGTPGYMAPEQVFAQTELDARVDVYAFGLVAFELLAGAPPFVRDTAREVMVAHLIAVPPRVTEFRSDVSSDLADLIARAIEKAPSDRFVDGSELVAALAAL